ncbi:hypothetical protein [uncultured Tenacibaculum sp.]|uniref:hypothetical protein n=1 Tax=uncultured Tenacibaculum sp. TaxID=174713 RepID=UPI00260E8449|nr:hypothetical protein [uncultured Tenacibaculum sp.]
MITVEISILLIGAFVMYSTSSKVVLFKNSWLDSILNRSFSFKKIIGLTILCSALIYAMFSYGFTLGFLFWLFALSSLLSLIICIYPLRLFKTNYTVFVMFFSIVIELILNYAS